MAEKRNAYRVSVGKPEGKRPLGTARRRNVSWTLRETDWGGMDWIELVQDADRWRAREHGDDTVMNLRVL
jgi:hypothetical protein